MSFFYDLSTIVNKEMRLWIKNPAFTILRGLVFPVLWVLLFGYGFGGQMHDVPVALVSDDNSLQAQSFINALTNGPALKIHQTTYHEAMNMFELGDVFAVIIIPSGFGSTNYELTAYMDQTSPSVSSMIEGIVRSSAMSLSEPVSLRKTGYEVNNQVIYGKNIRYLDFMAPGIALMTIIFTTIFAGGLTLIFDKQFGTLKSLLVAPISRGAIILGKTVAGTIQAMTAGVVALFLLVLIGVNFSTGIYSVPIILLILFLTSLGFMGMGTAFASRVTTIEQFAAVIQIIILPLWFVSGALYPVESMPIWLQAIAFVNPLTYATHALRTVMLRNIVINALLLDLSVLVGFAFIMFLLGVKSFKKLVE